MISIIITCYNSASTIKRAIDSCLNQTYNDIELVIIDDCSIDNSVEIIESYKDNRIKLIKHEVNKGAGLARRTGTKNIKGEYTIFLDSDDYLATNTLEVLIEAAIKYDADIIAPGYISVP